MMHPPSHPVINRAEGAPPTPRGRSLKLFGLLMGPITPTGSLFLPLPACCTPRRSASCGHISLARSAASPSQAGAAQSSCSPLAAAQTLLLHFNRWVYHLLCNAWHRRLSYKSLKSFNKQQRLSWSRHLQSEEEEEEEEEMKDLPWTGGGDWLIAVGWLETFGGLVSDQVIADIRDFRVESE